VGRSLNLWLAVLVVVCGVSLWLTNGGTLPSGPGPGSTGPGATDNPDAFGVTDPVHLRVLNGTGVSGLARDISLQVVPLGCVVEGVGNVGNGDTAVSVLINRRLADAAAQRLADRLGGIPVVRQWDDRRTEDAVLILGGDWDRVDRRLNP